MKRALVLGCNGQTGSYLCEHLLAQGQTVHGMIRHSSSPRQLWRIEPILDRLTLHEGDLTDYSSLDRIVREVQPHEVFNLADQDSVGYSQLVPLYSVQVTYGGVANLLEVVRRHDPVERAGGHLERVRVFQPISATIFKPKEYWPIPPNDWGHREAWRPCNEETELDPQSPYAVAKTAAWHLCRHYRQKYGMHITCAIPFNHDSPRRNSGYLLGELARKARLVASGKMEAVTVGSTDLRVDIGFAGEFAAAYIKLLELPEPTDCVLGTGLGIRIIDLADYALTLASSGPPPEVEEWMRKSVSGHTGPKPSYKGLIDKVKVDASLGSNRLVELVADCAKARALIGWGPEHNALSVLRMLMEERYASR